MTNPNEDWVEPIFVAIEDDILRSGYFDRVNKHESITSPGNGLTASIWLQEIEPLGEISGLATTSGRLLFIVRCQTNVMQEPQDVIDPNLTRAVSNLMRRFHDDFDFGGAIRNVDLLGQFGYKLQAEAGYIEYDRGSVFRIMDLRVPCLVNDIWPQVQ